MQVLIASRRAVARRALAGLLQARPEPEVVAEVVDMQELLERTEVTSPDIVLLDSDLGNGPLEKVVGALRQLDHPPKVVVLGSSSGSEQAALAAGADAFVGKGDPPRYLLTALYGVYLEGQE